MSLSKLVVPGLMGLTNMLLMIRCLLAALAPGIKSLPKGAGGLCPRCEVLLAQILAPGSVDSECLLLALWARNTRPSHTGHELLEALTPSKAGTRHNQVLAPGNSGTRHCQYEVLAPGILGTRHNKVLAPGIASTRHCQYEVLAPGILVTRHNNFKSLPLVLQASGTTDAPCSAFFLETRYRLLAPVLLAAEWKRH